MISHKFLKIPPLRMNHLDQIKTVFQLERNEVKFLKNLTTLLQNGQSRSSGCSKFQIGAQNVLQYQTQ